MHVPIGWFLFWLAGAIVASYFIGRNNPNLKAVNGLISAERWVVNEFGKLTKKKKS